ncbi:multidrug resistance-associated ABC transporter [Mycena filopes]|nr:multidrug resistance-associated ABC transporter [Mycena filopes]
MVTFTVDSLVVPVLTSSLSAAFLVLYLVFGPVNEPHKGTKKQITVLDIGRLAACVALVPLSTQDAVASQNLKTGLIATYVYAVILALASICTQSPTSDRTTRHLNVVLLSALGVYLYRDILPLGAVSDTPQDSREGIRLWFKIALLAFTGALAPLLAPRNYSPVDPLNPMEPNPEQTASILSLALYLFLDHTIFLAHRLVRLPYDLFPPLADYDAAGYLKSQNFRHINPGRHLFFGIIRIFRFDIFVLALTSAVIVVGRFVAPVGLNRLLHYVETQGQGEIYRPWVWVLWLFLGPTIHTLGDQWYMYIVSRASVRIEAILTELVFEHALRMRIKSQPASKVAGKLNVNNLITTDIRIIIASKRLLLSLVYMPLMFILSIWFLYAILGWSAFVGLATIFAMLPVPGYVGKWVQVAQRDLAKKRDARVQSVTETINLLRMIKFFGWETKMSAEVAAKRQMELVCLWKRKLLDLGNGCIKCVHLIFQETTVIMQRQLTASRVFSSMAVFDMFKISVESILSSYTQFLTSKVSFDRMDSFLRQTELLDVYSSDVEVSEIGFHNATFSWSAPATDDASVRQFSLRIDHLIFRKGCINLILGQTGSGKTSLLLSLLESSKEPESWYNLPRDGGVAYAAQESWVQSATIKPERYKKVLYQCCLERDLELFAAGDEQVVGERGLTLSGGQKARVTLARAIYSRASILLLDDVLAALDVHTAKHVVEKCFAGDLVTGRTVLLVTHNIALTRSISQFTVSLGLDGRVMSQGTVHDALKIDEKLSIEASDDQARLESAPAETETDTSNLPDKKPAASGKLIMPEEITEGNVGWSPVRLYLRSLGGTHPHLFFLALLAGLAVQNFAGNLQTWFVVIWAFTVSSEVEHRFQPLFAHVILGSILLLLFFFYACGFLVYTFGILRASKTLHQQLMDSVLGTTLRWLDTTPTSRIIARATQDMGMVDGPISASLRSLVDQSVSIVVTFGAIVLFTPLFFGPGVLLFVLGSYFGRLFMPARISVKREMSNARSPVLGHFAAAVTGLTSIRAYACQGAFIHESFRRLDRYSRTARLSFDLTRWSAVRTQLLSHLFTTALAVYLGFTLEAAVRFGGTITSWILCLNDFELILERIEAYINIEQEPKSTASGIPPAAWPTSGELVVRNLSARYSEDGPNVLDDISFEVKSGERIGVVGRTGAGKSSLTLALLRAIPTTGSVSYDGITTSSINLDSLRSKITIIPQMPELLRGTLRQNLDPFGQYEDGELKAALDAAGLSALATTETAEHNITLETEISSGGSNLSVGQRQTDAVIQNSLRTKLGSDRIACTPVMDADRIVHGPRTPAASFVSLSSAIK